jgi:hypothetical protein
MGTKVGVVEELDVMKPPPLVSIHPPKDDDMNTYVTTDRTLTLLPDAALKRFLVSLI